MIDVENWKIEMVVFLVHSFWEKTLFCQPFSLGIERGSQNLSIDSHETFRSSHNVKIILSLSPSIDHHLFKPEISKPRVLMYNLEVFVIVKRAEFGKSRRVVSISLLL